MSQFSQSSAEKLSTCHTDLQILFKEVIKEYDCTVLCGHRGEEEQNKAFKAGNSKLQWPNSKHNTAPALAADVVPYESTGVDYGKLQSADFSGYVKGIADMLFRQGRMDHKIRRGADWNGDNNVDDTTFWDAGHFELIPN